jgi:hypothetical protein
MEFKRLEFSIEPQQSAIIVRLPRPSIEPLRLKLAEFISNLYSFLQTKVFEIRQKLAIAFSYAYEATQKLEAPSRLGRLLGRLRGRRPNASPKKVGRFLIYAFFVILIVFGLSKVIQISRETVSQATDERIEIQGAKATIELNREFTFPLRDNNGNEISDIKYIIRSAELRDEIIVKGSRATAVKGRTFLILNLKISNEYDQTISINTRDYVRLTVNDNEEEKLAPDIHNDPVEVQAISTKLTRIGFPVNDTDENLKLYVGEISGDKEIIELNF